MATVSISEAARLVGVSRKTIQRHIDTGKLSATMSQDNVSGRPTPLRHVETSELLRVYGKFVTSDVAPQPATSTPNVPTLSQPNDAALSQVIEAQKETIDLLKRHVDELTIEKRDLRAQVVGLLEYRKPAPANKKWQTAILGVLVIGLAVAAAMTIPLWWRPH